MPLGSTCKPSSCMSPLFHWEFSSSFSSSRGEGEEGWSHSNTKANLFVSKEKLLAPLPDEGINNIWRHLDIERGGRTRGRHAVSRQKQNLTRFFISVVWFKLTRLPVSKQKAEGMTESPPLCDALVRCSLGMLRSRNSNHFPWKSPGWMQPQTKPPGISASCQWERLAKNTSVWFWHLNLSLLFY